MRPGPPWARKPGRVCMELSSWHWLPWSWGARWVPTACVAPGGSLWPPCAHRCHVTVSIRSTGFSQAYLLPLYLPMTLQIKTGVRESPSHGRGLGARRPGCSEPRAHRGPLTHPLQRHCGVCLSPPCGLRSGVRNLAGKGPERESMWGFVGHTGSAVCAFFFFFFNTL